MEVVGNAVVAEDAVVVGVVGVVAAELVVVAAATANAAEVANVAAAIENVAVVVAKVAAENADVAVAVVSAAAGAGAAAVDVVSAVVDGVDAYVAAVVGIDAAAVANVDNFDVEIEVVAFVAPDYGFVVLDCVVVAVHVFVDIVPDKNLHNEFYLDLREHYEYIVNENVLMNRNCEMPVVEQECVL